MSLMAIVGVTAMIDLTELGLTFKCTIIIEVMTATVSDVVVIILRCDVAVMTRGN